MSLTGTRVHVKITTIGLFVATSSRSLRLRGEKRGLAQTMEQLVSIPGREVRFDRIVPPLRFRSPFEGNEFVLLLIVDDIAVSDDDRATLCKEFIEQGCRYAVCVGPSCEKWHDAIDWVLLATDPNFNPSDDSLVMTTWHANESLDDVVFFFLNNTSFGFFKAERFVICHVGQIAEVEQEVKSLIVRSCQGRS